MRKRLLFASWAASLVAVIAMPMAVSATTGVPVYDALPSTLPPNVASLGFEATSTSEFGDSIHLGGTNRSLKTITVTMSDWALFSDYSSDVRYSGNSVSWSHPITVNVYSSHLGVNGVPDTLLATTTQAVTIPWRPVADPTCAGGTAWRASDSNCYNGYAFNATFDLSSLNVVLPSDVIVGVAYNTADYGAAPIHQAGPYNSLNVGVPSAQSISIGSDNNVGNVFWNTSNAGFYADGGAAGVGTFREDTAWVPNGTVALNITAGPTDTTADTPTHLSPTNNSYRTTATLTSIDWNDVTDVSNPVTYRYQSSNSPALNGDGSFVSPAYTSGALSTSQIATGGTPTGVWYWHVKAVDGLGNESAWSAPWKITVDNTAPIVPTHSAPTNNGVVNSHNFTFMWNSSADISGPVTYDWEASYSGAVVATGGAFSSQLASHTGLTLPSVYSPSTPDNVYYWHVRAIDAVGNTSAWSTPWKVTVKTAPTTINECRTLGWKAFTDLNFKKQGQCEKFVVKAQLKEAKQKLEAFIATLKLIFNVRR